LQNGLFSSLPYLGKYVFAVLTSALADHLLRTERLSRTATRKIFTAFGKVPLHPLSPAVSKTLTAVRPLISYRHYIGATI
jgi:hypothetical protein